jgi:acyl-coenzyme A thioesterase PaaI-like protein
MASNELFTMIRDGLGSSVPFASYVGVELDTVDDGSAQASLRQQPHTLNYLATAHAGAMFSLAETASGAAVAGAFAEQIFEVRPIVRSAKVIYLKVGRGDLTAHATSRLPAAELRTALGAQGRAEFVVDVAVRNAEGAEIAKFEAEWVVTTNKKP